MDIDIGTKFDPVRRDALLAILDAKGKHPTIYARPYGEHDERIQRKYWVDLLRYTQRVLNGSWV